MPRKKAFSISFSQSYTDICCKSHAKIITHLRIVPFTFSTFMGLVGNELLYKDQNATSKHMGAGTIKHSFCFFHCI